MICDVQPINRAMAEFVIESPTSHATLGIRFGGDYSELCIGDRPLALTWSISDGSIMDHLIRCDHPDGVAHLKIFRDSLLGCPEEAAVLEFARSILAAGVYRTLVTDFYQVDACLTECSLDAAHPTVFYGGCFSLVTTLPDSELSETRVSHYEQMILAGQRPLAVALCCYDHTHHQPTTAFLIDGHHKVAAYQRCRLYSHVLVIARCDPPAPTQAYPSAFAASRLLP